jgi:1-acyl-sn-glycerol-3-phosphate acyltransferase
MHRTIFSTPVVNTALRACSVAVLRLAGWRIEGALPPGAGKCVMIAAPHTSNWDLPYTLMTAFVLRLNIYWMGKAQLFTPPFGSVMRWLGGIAVRREQRNSLVAASAAALLAADGPVQLVVPPEGTRSKVRHWKTGFYYIALSAKLPILLTYMDYADKRAGIGPLFHPTGDVERDMAAIKAFYAPMRGKNARQFDAERGGAPGARCTARHPPGGLARPACEHPSPVPASGVREETMVLPLRYKVNGSAVMTDPA